MARSGKDQSLKSCATFLADGGEMGELIRSHDWLATSLGDPVQWCQPLRTAVRVLLNTGHPMYIFWGPELLCFYNDAYRHSIGPERHPCSLGQPARQVWDEIWPIIGPQIDQVMSGGGATWHENQLVPITRNGKREDVYWTYSYGPIDDEAAPSGVGGVLVVCTETTEQVLARKSLAEEQERQHRMLQQMPGFAALLNGPDHRFEYVNNAFQEITGRREFVGRTFRDVFPELVDQGLVEMLDRVFSTGKSFEARSQPLDLNRPDGNRFVDFIYEPVRDSSNKVTGIFVGGHDVTTLVRATRRREALLSLDERLLNVENTAELSFAASEVLAETLGAVRAGYGILDPKRRTITVERSWTAPGYLDVPGVHSFADYGEYIHELLAGRPVAVRDAASDPRTAAHIRSFQLLGIGAHIDAPVMEGGQAVAEMFVHSAQPRNWTDEEVEFVQEFADRARLAIARRTAEAALRESEERFRQLAQAVDQVFHIADPIARKLLYVSPAYERIWGQSAAPLYEDLRKFLTNVHPDDRERVAEAQARPHDRPHEPIEYRIVRPDGEVRWIRDQVFPVASTSTGGPTLVGIADDVTERRKAEAQLVELNNNLEQRVRERTADLENAHEQLRQSQKLESMGQLTGGVAHDFNNLLTPIVGALDVLQRQRVGGEREQRLIAGAAKSADRARILVQRLLAFARRQPLQPTAVNVGGLVEGMAALIASTTGPQIKVQVDVENGVAAAKADPNQLEMALLNLAVNARDAMPDGGTLRISVNAGSTDAARRMGLSSGSFVVLSVADTGGGMDAPTVQRAIEPFFSTKGVGKGTGLGLSMVHGLAAQLGGTLRIKSKVGVGTNVELWLPESSENVAHLDPVAQLQAAGLSGTALLVDDEDMVRLSTADMLSELGYRVLEANCAEEAMKIAAKEPIDLLVTDHLMPGMSGVELSRELKCERPHLKVLIVSGFAEVEGIAPDLPRLTKPFLQNELASALMSQG